MQASSPTGTSSSRTRSGITSRGVPAASPRRCRRRRVQSRRGRRARAARQAGRRARVPVDRFVPQGAGPHHVGALRDDAQPELCSSSRWTEIPKLRARFGSVVSVLGERDSFNQSLEKAGRVADFLEFGELMCQDALAREESCGAHFSHRVPDRRRRGEARRRELLSRRRVGARRDPGAQRRATRVFENVKLATRSYKGARGRPRSDAPHLAPARSRDRRGGLVVHRVIGHVDGMRRSRRDARHPQRSAGREG